MKIGLHYRNYGDVCVVMHMLSNSKFDRDNDKFIFYYNNDEYIFSRDINIINEMCCDIKIFLFTTLNEWKSFKGYDRLIQTQTTENYFITNNQLKEYLDAGNISLSAASISFEHPNFYFDPMFNLIFFYNFYGFNFLNYYKFDKKENLLGVYHKPVKEIGNGKMHRNYLFEKIKQILNEDFTPYESLDYNLKSIVQPYEGFGHWGNNHITSYIDLTTSVCNVIFETMSANGNLEKDEHEYSYYGRQYITEKTLKAICFSEENIFFIWYGPHKLYKHLMELGFWFLNSEFYDESIELSYGNDELSILYANVSYSHMEQSVVDTALYLKDLKEQYKTNKEVHNYLVNTYGHKLEKNVELFKTILNDYNKKDLILNLVKNGN
jgi:hypothetical protein